MRLLKRVNPKNNLPSLNIFFSVIYIIFKSSDNFTHKFTDVSIVFLNLSSVCYLATETMELSFLVQCRTPSIR